MALGEWVRKHARSLVFLALFVVVSAFFVGASGAVKHCTSEEQKNHSQQTAQESPSVFGLVVISRRCWGVFLEENDKALVVLATVGLLIVTGLLAFYTFQLWKTTGEMVARADVNTASQIRVMEGQLAAMQQQGTAASQTLDQIRREFAVAHRPKVRLRRIYFAGSTKDFVPIRTPDGGGGYTETPSPTKTAAPVIIEMAHVDGVGVANATLRVTFKIFNTDQPIPWEIQDELARAVPQEMQISQSGSGVLLVKVPAVAALFSDSGVLSGSQTVYCVGYAEYSDGSGELTGRTGFIRRCDIRNWWFLPDHSPGGADFEYAD